MILIIQNIKRLMFNFLLIYSCLLLIFLIIANVLRPRLKYCNVEDVILYRYVQAASQFRSIGYHYIKS